jgi:metal-responsive CopG/Arc/MetJ family transcriptional regulator
MKKEIISISIDKELKNNLSNLSKSSGKNQSEFIRDLIKKGLERDKIEQVLEEKLKKFKDDLSGTNSSKFKLLTSEITKNQTNLSNMMDEINNKVDKFVDENKAFSNINEAKIVQIDTNIRSLKNQITNGFSQFLELISDNLINKDTVEDIKNTSLRIRVILNVFITNLLLKTDSEKSTFKKLVQETYKKHGL